MGIRDHNLENGTHAVKSFQDNIRGIAVPAIAAMGTVGALVVDLPEFLTAIVVIAVVLGILWAADFAFVKAREVLSGIWLIGRSLVKGLDAIYRWEYSVF